MVTYFECYKFNREWLLVEMVLEIPSSEIDWESMVVPDGTLDRGNWQCPYLVQYLNAEGTEKICGTYEQPKDAAGPCRVAFFIFRDGARVLQTAYGDFDLTKAGRMPRRLKRIVAFEVD